ncbi:MAG: sigma-70 family RNA polymerase sigma factor, partial [Lentisphaeria bacterium]|nr:sigma-70 family RNA polymerase sigma factor [Lentisphaeria bacterium]
TKKSLLAKVREGDEVSWGEFYEAYRPLILLCGSDCSLTPDENEELVQQVMAELFTKDVIGKYDPDHIPEDVVFHYDPKRGRFRHFLKKIVRNQAVRIYYRRFQHSPLEEAEGVCGENSFDSIWDEEWKRHVLNMALFELKGKVKPETFAAFEMYALQNRKLEEVCSFLDLSPASVYTAKSRCIAALKEIIAKLEEK